MLFIISSPIFQQNLGGNITSKNISDLSVTSVFLQQLWKIHKHILNSIEQSTVQQFLSGDFVETCSSRSEMVKASFKSVN